MEIVEKAIDNNFIGVLEYISKNTISLSLLKRKRLLKCFVLQKSKHIYILFLKL